MRGNEMYNPYSVPGLLSTSVMQSMQASQKNANGMSLEQSLAFDLMTRFSVLHDVRGGNRVFAHHAHEDQSEKSLDWTDGRSTRTSRRGSITDNFHQDTDYSFDYLNLVRLAISTDHAVWCVHPVTGFARIIAGHPQQYGFYDASNGLNARFSSPKGLINIRSVVFVADYWNNVVRCINLFTTQVDTVVDFNPQGPVGMCMSPSGVLYVLDSDNIHYMNILQIMSARRGSGSNGFCNRMMSDDRWFYQSFFEQPYTKTRSSSLVSASTQKTKNSAEIWDSNTGHSNKRHRNHDKSRERKAMAMMMNNPWSNQRTQTHSSRISLR